MTLSVVPASGDTMTDAIPPASDGRRKIPSAGRRAVLGQGRELRHVRARRGRPPLSAAGAHRRRLRVDAPRRREHGAHLHRARPAVPGPGPAARSPDHGRRAVGRPRRVPRRPALVEGHPARRHGSRARGRVASGRADAGARQRDSRRHRALARPRARRAVSRRALCRCQGDRARHALHLRQLSADRVPQPAVRRPGRVQCLPASRARSPRVPGATAEHRRSQAAARGRSRRRQRAGGREWTGRAHGDATPRVVCRGRLRRRGICVDGRMVAGWTGDQRLGVRPGRCRATPEAGAAVGRRGLLERAVCGEEPRRA